MRRAAYGRWTARLEAARKAHAHPADAHAAQQTVSTGTGSWGAAERSEGRQSAFETRIGATAAADLATERWPVSNVYEKPTVQLTVYCCTVLAW